MKHNSFVSYFYTKSHFFEVSLFIQSNHNHKAIFETRPTPVSYEYTFIMFTSSRLSFTMVYKHLTTLTNIHLLIISTWLCQSKQPRLVYVSILLLDIPIISWSRWCWNCFGQILWFNCKYFKLFRVEKGQICWRICLFFLSYKFYKTR